MRFYVIYSVDVPQGESLSPWTPRGKAWKQTESGKTEYDLGTKWEKGRHRKYVAYLSRQQFELFLDQIGLHAENVETMGSITEFGHLPAISFTSVDEEAIVNAHVTPMPEVKMADNPPPGKRGRQFALTYRFRCGDTDDAIERRRCNRY